MSISDPLAEAIGSLAADPPATFYHYTSAPSCLSILDGDELWASHAGFLDDLSEISHAVSIARQVCADLEDELGAEHRRLLRALAGALGNFAQVPVFVASFSESGDLLSQWRAYCKYPGGYAIGIAPSYLAPRARTAGFALAKCRYGRDEQRAVLDRLIKDHVAAYLSKDVAAERNALQAAGSDAPATDQIRGMLGDVARVAAFLKHPSFVEEREWRIVSLGESVAPKFRVAGGRLVPYVPFSLRSTKRDEGYVTELVVGPSPFPERAVEAAGGLLRLHGHGCTPHLSSAPFAMW